MTNDIYRVNDLATLAGETISDLSGIDWINAAGTSFFETTIRLDWFVENDVVKQANARLWEQAGARSLTINGLIENVRGSDVRDWIQGNSAGNILYGDQAATGAGDNDTLVGAEGRDTIFGGTGNDSINGGADGDLIQGNAGNDTISGAEGRDTVEGGAGADSLSGGSEAGDTLSYRGSLAGVTVVLEAGTFATVAGGHATGDIVFGFTDVLGSDLQDTLREDEDSGTIQQDNRYFGFGGNDFIYLGGGDDLGDGGDGRDLIGGRSGRDTLRGGEGEDQIIGGAGGDVLTGGADRDVFLFYRTSESTVALTGRDRITDFSRTQDDQIRLDGIDARADVVGNQAFAFIGKAGAFTAAGQVRIVDAGDFLVVLGNVDRDAEAEFAIRVDGPANLFAGDFIL